MKTFVHKKHGIPITCYYTPSKGYAGWTIRHDRRRIFKASKEDIEAEADRIIDGIWLGKGAANQLSASEATEYKEAQRIAAEAGKPLLVVLSEYSEATKLLARRCTLIHAAQHWIDTAQGVTARTVSEVITEFLASKSDASPRHLADLKNQLDRFALTFSGHIGTLQGPEVDSWLTNTYSHPRTRANAFAAIRNLCNFAIRRRYLPKNFNELDSVTLPHVETPAPVCYSPEQFGKLLDYAHTKRDARLVVYLVLRGMLGLRDAEAMRVKADQIRDGHFVVEASQAKLRRFGRRRLIPLHGTSGEWLKRYAPKKGLLIVNNRGGRFGMIVRAAHVAAKVPKHHNGLRDSFISYRMAQTRDAAQVSDEAGNSPGELHRHYRELTLPDGRLITPALAEEWFSRQIPDRKPHKTSPFRTTKALKT